MTRNPTFPEIVAEAWALREEIRRRLMLVALERARLEHALACLDDTFAGEPLPHHIWEDQ